MSLYETLKERGYISNVTHEKEIKHALDNEKLYFYIGFDPTADSLHVGHFLTLMATRLLQKHGHVPILLMGGGTGMVGDPSGRTDMRKVLTVEEINHNVENFKKQVSHLVSLEDGQTVIANNADWLRSLNYMDFLRDFGTHFTVNRMLAAEAYKSRYEHGLTFLEFNYMIMQAYDFLELNKRFGAKLQLGGSDQWSNIIAGVDLIRRVENKEAYGMTLSLLEKADGQKMGKTAGGALWLDANKTSAYDFYQYFRNVEDAVVTNCLKLLTELPMSEIEELSKLTGKEINIAKERLAFEVTKLVHGETQATAAKEAALSLFSTHSVDADSIPSSVYSKVSLESGVDILTLLSDLNLVASKSEARRLIAQGGIRLNEIKVEADDLVVTPTHLKEDYLLIQKGKKVFLKVTFE